MDIISKSATQLILFFVIIIGFTLLLTILQRIFLKLTGRVGIIITYSTGVIGTPVHELSHALFCLIFGHKIEAISLFRISDDGVLGYVEHSYNESNWYQKLGNFFIGIAPIFGGAAVIFLLVRFMSPTAYNGMIDAVDNISTTTIFSSTFWSELFVVIGESIKAFFVLDVKNGLWWVCMILVLCISTHMCLSRADMRGSLSGIILFVVAIIVANVITYFCKVQGNMHNVIMQGLFLTIPPLIIAIGFSVLEVIFGFIFKKILKKHSIWWNQ